MVPIVEKSWLGEALLRGLRPKYVDAERHRRKEVWRRDSPCYRRRAAHENVMEPAAQGYSIEITNSADGRVAALLILPLPLFLFCRVLLFMVSLLLTRLHTVLFMLYLVMPRLFLVLRLMAQRLLVLRLVT